MVNSLNGKTFVLTGQMQMEREDAVHRIVMLGGRVTTAISRKTTYLVTGEEPGQRKLEKAKELGIEIMNEETFLKMIDSKNLDDKEYSTSIEKTPSKTTKEIPKKNLFSKYNLKAVDDKDGKLTTKRIKIEDENFLTFGDLEKDINQLKTIKHTEQNNEINDNSTDIIENPSKHINNTDVFVNITRSKKDIFKNNLNEKNTKESNLDPTSEIANFHDVWAQKYRPQTISDLVGNQSIVQELRKFLEGKSQHKSVLLSGSPGVGKTTMAHVVAKDLGLDVVEFNASDTRSKKEISSKIKDTIDFLSVGCGSLKKKVLVMDEIDGMSSDRGGIAELSAMLKKTKIPVICICNDRNSPKMRTLAGNCLDLRFRKLLPSQIIPRLNHILSLEGKTIPSPLLNEIVASSSGDLRYCLNTLQHVCARKTVSIAQTKLSTRKTPLRSIFDLASDIFSSRNVQQKMDAYFEDYNFVPLFVHENYLKAKSTSENLVYAAESLSFADTIDAKIHSSSQEWSLLPLHAFYSCVFPTKNRPLRSRLDFPLILGQRSKMIKNRKILTESSIKTYPRFFVQSFDFRTDVLDLFCTKFLTIYGQTDITFCLNFLSAYNLSKEEMESLIEILISGPSLLKGISTKAKRALTTALKKIKPSINIKNTKKSEEDSSTSYVDDDERIFDLI